MQLFDWAGVCIKADSSDETMASSDCTTFIKSTRSVEDRWSASSGLPSLDTENGGADNNSFASFTESGTNWVANWTRNLNTGDASNDVILTENSVYRVLFAFGNIDANTSVIQKH
jgi:hypothetical protein